MAPATLETPDIEQVPTPGDWVVDACGQAAHFSHDARLLTSVTQDAIEDGVHAARRAIKTVRRRVELLDDTKNEAIHRLKRRPLVAVDIGVGIGLALGFAVGWIACRPERHD